MNRYPLWKNLLIGLVLMWGLIYTLPNFYGEVPAVQVSSGKATLKLDSAATMARVEESLKAAGLQHNGLFADLTSVRVRFSDTDTQLKAKDAIEKSFNPDAADPSYVVALNLLSASPQWLTSIHALPMYLGLDLRGGVHFLLQVDMKGAVTKRLDATTGDLRTLLRDKNVRHSGISREGQSVVVKFRDTETQARARNVITASTNDLQLVDGQDGADYKLTATLTPMAQKTIQEFAIKQNISTLHNRINELGVAEPVIQQQGLDRIVVQLPGVQDVAKAKDILGRTATLEIRMVDDAPGALEAALNGSIPPGSELYSERGGSPLLVKKQVVLTGAQGYGVKDWYRIDSESRVALADFDAAIKHDAEDARSLGHRIAVLEAGKITQAGTWAELAAKPASRFIAEFVASARSV